MQSNILFNLTPYSPQLGVLPPNTSTVQFEEIDPSFQTVFRNTWADHANLVSVQYAGTGALKTDFTRTGMVRQYISYLLSSEYTLIDNSKNMMLFVSWSPASIILLAFSAPNGVYCKTGGMRVYDTSRTTSLMAFGQMACIFSSENCHQRTLPTGSCQLK